MTITKSVVVTSIVIFIIVVVVVVVVIVADVDIVQTPCMHHPPIRAILHLLPHPYTERTRFVAFR